MSTKRSAGTSDQKPAHLDPDKNHFCNVEDALIAVASQLGKEGGDYETVQLRLTQGGEVAYRGYLAGETDYVGGVIRP